MLSLATPSLTKSSKFLRKSFTFAHQESILFSMSSNQPVSLDDRIISWKNRFPVETRNRTQMNALAASEYARQTRNDNNPELHLMMDILDSCRVEEPCPLKYRISEINP